MSLFPITKRIKLLNIEILLKGSAGYLRVNLLSEQIGMSYELILDGFRSRLCHSK